MFSCLPGIMGGKLMGLEAGVGGQAALSAGACTLQSPSQSYSCPPSPIHLADCRLSPSIYASRKKVSRRVWGGVRLSGSGG